MTNLISQILDRDEFRQRPPVLLDIGASSQVHAPWNPFKHWSTCIAFDADDREMGHLKQEKGFAKLHVIGKIVVSDAQAGTSPFYLTQSPFCSSTLKPANSKLSPWLFSDLFEVVQTASLPVTTITEAMGLAGVDYIDWFKTDSQGTDLRLFASTPEKIRQRILVAEFEPGIIDAYEGEDKLSRVLDHLDTPDWWIANLDVLGSLRFDRQVAARYFSQDELGRMAYCLKPGAGWAGVTAMATLPRLNGKRDLLLAWIFAHTQGHYGFATEIAAKGQEIYPDPIFLEMLKESLRPLRISVSRNILVRLCRRLKRSFSSLLYPPP